jgi:hypothetical protein
MIANLKVQTLDVEGLVINIHGVPASTTLPATIQGSKDSFPISCGVLIRDNSGGTSVGTTGG